MVNLKELELTDAFVELVRRAATELPADMEQALGDARQSEEEGSAAEGKIAMMLSLLAGALVLGLWAWVSSMAVPGSRLAQSTIPHIIAAREIGGDTGRVLMGIAVLSGAAGALNALLLAVPRNLLTILPAAFSAASEPHVARWKRLAVLILGVSIAGMLASGMAGEPALDVWGMRKMAYEIQKFKQGYYLHYNARLDSTRIPEIERRLQYMEDVLRYLVVRKID